HHCITVLTFLLHFFFSMPLTRVLYPLSLHDALPIWSPLAQIAHPGIQPAPEHPVGPAPTSKEKHHAVHRSSKSCPHAAASRRDPRPERGPALPHPLDPHLGAPHHRGEREHPPRRRREPLPRGAPPADA